MTKPSRAVSYGREAFSGCSLKPADMAPMASNSMDICHDSSSPPPANITSCMPQAICCAATPMQLAEVLQAAVME